MINKALKIVAFFIFSVTVTAQNTGLKVGDPGMPLILNNNQAAQQSISFPYLNKIVLVHFWSSSVSKSKPFIPRLIDLYERYSTTTYRNTEGFEVFTVAVQSDKTAWNEDILNYKMDNITNLIANRGYNDLSIRGYKITQLPVTMLIDEKGIIIMINPTMMQIEDVLDGKKNSPPNTKDLKGRLLLSEKPTDALKNHKLVLMNKFSDTLTRTVTDNTGTFTFYGVKFLKEYIIKLDTSGSLSTSPKAFISTGSGAVFGAIEKTSGKFEYTLNSNDIAKLSANEKEIASAKNAVMLNANFTFKTGTSEFDSNAEPELNKIAIMMTKNKEYTLEIIAHTDCKGDDAANLELSKKRAAAIKSYLVTQGIPALRMRPVGKGESEIINKCKNGVPCSDAEHLENSRVELKFHKP